MIEYTLSTREAALFCKHRTENHTLYGVAVFLSNDDVDLVACADDWTHLHDAMINMIDHEHESIIDKQKNIAELQQTVAHEKDYK